MVPATRRIIATVVAALVTVLSMAVLPQLPASADTNLRDPFSREACRMGRNTG